LIELMITLTILGFIVLMIFGTFRLGLSAWDKGESLKEEYQKVRIISQLISQQIKSIVPYKIKAQKAEGDYLAFEGKARSLKFVSALPMKARQSGGLVYAVYEFREEGNNGRLVVYEQRVVNKDFFEEELKDESAVSLLEGISTVKFEYYREEDALQNRQEEWVEEWNAKEEKELPRAVKITITMRNGKGGKEEFPITVLGPIAANRFEDVTVPVRRSVPGLRRLRGTTY
jgi:general secretion pathway protein J